MAGLFPKDGVPPNETVNAINPAVGAGCKVLFHAALCAPRFNPAAANAVISEITQAVNLIAPYDCERLDNLAQLIEMDLCGIGEAPFTPAIAFLAGCFNGLSGKITLQSLINWIINNTTPAPSYSICSLPFKNDVLDTDRFALCGWDGETHSDITVTATGFKNYFKGGSGSKSFLFGPRIGSLQDLNGVLQVSGRKAFFVQDLRAESGGQNPQIPGQLEMMGYKIDRLEGPGLPTLTWEYGVVWLMKFDNSLGAWVRIHRSGLSWAIPNSNVPQLQFNSNSDIVRLYDAIPMD